MAQLPLMSDTEYKKHANVKREDIRILWDWLKTQLHLPHENITDADLEIPYHSCDSDLELTKKVIDLNYTLRSIFTFYQNRNVDKTLERAFESWLVTPLEILSNKGYRPIYCQILNPDPNLFVYSDVVRAFVMIIDLCLHEEGTIPGVSVIVNLDKVSISHMSRVELGVAQQFFYFLQEAMFVRLKEFHFINAPGFIDKLLSMFKPFMKEELLQMLHVHQSGSNTFKDYIPISALPKDAGGENYESSVLKDKIWDKLKANEVFFKEESKKKSNESLRPSGPRTLKDFFPGMESSFKKLEID